MDFTTEELLLKLQESGINVTEEEAQRFREHEVDGEALECGLTDTMVSSLFSSFKKQAQFLQFIRRNKIISITLEPVPEYDQPTGERRHKCRVCFKQLKHLSNVIKMKASYVGRHGSAFKELQLIMAPLDDVL